MNVPFLRSKYEQCITQHETEIQKLRVKLEVLSDLEADSGNGVPAPPQQVNTNGDMKYAGWTITKAVIDAVKTIGAGRQVSAAEVRKYITNHGYQHTSKYFASTTVITLKRLAASKDGPIISEKIGDNRVYMARK